jgi:threonine dehydrogenase-like Zn-dependent dehydrogenase
MSSSYIKAICVRPSLREVAQVEHPAPRIARDDQVRIRTLEVGVCGTDREICTFVYGAPPFGDDYLVIGHESLGEVVEVGSDVKSLKAGELVVASVRRPCPHDHCRPCRDGLQDYCATGDFVERGINQVHGFMTEAFVESEHCLHAVPFDLREVAVLTEPLTIAEKGVEQAFLLQSRLPWASAEPGRPRGEGLRAVVLGAGPIGLLGAMKLVHEGFETTVYSRSPAPNPKADIARAIGARYVSTREVTPAQLAEETGNIDLIYEAVGVPSVVFELLPHLGLNGVYVFTGIPEPQAAIPVQAGQLMRDVVLKNQIVAGTVNADPRAFRDAIRDLGEFKRRWPDALAGLITKRHRIDAYRELLLGPAQGIKNVVSFD